MDMKDSVFGEHSVTKIAGFFPDGDSAEAAANALSEAGILSPAKVRVMPPRHCPGSRVDELDAAIEQESQGIGLTLIRSHVTLALFGLVVGGLAGASLLGSGSGLARTHPMAWVLSTMFVGALLGIVAAAIVTVRPDHGALIRRIRTALGRGQWAVVAHPETGDQVRRALHVLEASGVPVARTL